MNAASQYDRCAQEAAAAVIGAYSTSFALACRLLGPRVRTQVRNIYALVRIADEIVDGAADGAGVSTGAQRTLLDALEDEVRVAIVRGFSTNLLAHAFALTARECGIGDDLVRPFFASMRTDLSRARHDPASHDAYVYGSAEVIGVMCLHVFVNAGRPAALPPERALVDGARRLGAAFQEVNFLRDRADDESRLGRDYLGLSTPHAGAAARAEVLARIEADLDAAAGTIPMLPADCRRAVTTAHGLFAELTRRLRSETADARISVPAPVKATIAARALIGFGPRRMVA